MKERSSNVEGKRKKSMEGGIINGRRESYSREPKLRGREGDVEKNTLKGVEECVRACVRAWRKRGSEKNGDGRMRNEREGRKEGRGEGGRKYASMWT